MSFAVIKTGGKQYKVKASDILKIERLKESKAESKIEFISGNFEWSYAWFLDFKNIARLVPTKPQPPVIKTFIF